VIAGKRRAEASSIRMMLAGRQAGNLSHAAERRFGRVHRMHRSASSSAWEIPMRFRDKFWLTVILAFFALVHVSGAIIMAKPHQPQSDVQNLIPAAGD
jgi:hypothetical protein